MSVHSPHFPVAIAVAIIVAATSPCAAGPDDASPSVKITSPLGRMGTYGKVRIVAQIQAAPEATLKPIRFFIDGVLLGTDEDGPPYATEWLDENPYERREIAVEVEDNLGRIGRHAVELKPFEIVEVTGVSRVLLEAGIYDKMGRFVSGLGPSDFSVTEDGVPQVIDVVNQEKMPTTFALLIDSSQSMSRRIDFVRDAARRFLEFLRPKDQVLVVPFSRRLSAVTGPTDDRNTVLEAIGHIDSAGGTAILDSLVELVRKLPTDQGRCAVVLITDGYDENSVMSADDALAAVKSARATVYVVGIGGSAGISLKGERLLRRIASETGGQVFLPPREEELAVVHTRLASDAQNRYVVTYLPSNQNTDGSWRSVRLTTNPEYKVRTRDGYLAPEPPPIQPELEFTIMDADQRFVDLSAEDLLVVEDGVEQRIDAFHEAVAPVSIVLALDASGSMRRSAASVVDAAREFVAALRPEDSLAPLLFSDQSVFAHDLTKDRDSTIKAIDSYRSSGGTALYDGMWDSIMRLKRVEGRRAIVVMTDGRDENDAGTAAGSAHTLDDVVNLVKETNTAIFAIGLGTNVDRPTLEQLANLSGGHAYFPTEVAGLKAQYLRIVENLRRRYVLSYSSTNVARDGSWRAVHIEPRSPDIVVTSRGGYFAPVR